MGCSGAGIYETAADAVHRRLKSKKTIKLLALNTNEC